LDFDSISKRSQLYLTTVSLVVTVTMHSPSGINSTFPRHQELQNITLHITELYITELSRHSGR